MIMHSNEIDISFLSVPAVLNENPTVKKKTKQYYAENYAGIVWAVQGMSWADKTIIRATYIPLLWCRHSQYALLSTSDKDH